MISYLRPWQTRTHCCGHIVADTNVSPFARARNICCGHKFCVRDTKNVSDFVQKHFVSATNVSQFAQPKKHHGQQCVRNNVSSFTRAFTVSKAIKIQSWYVIRANRSGITGSLLCQWKKKITIVLKTGSLFCLLLCSELKQTVTCDKAIYIVF